MASRRGINRSRPVPKARDEAGRVPPDHSPPAQSSEAAPTPAADSLFDGQTANAFPASLPWHYDQMSLFLDQTTPVTPAPTDFQPKPCSLSDRYLASFYRNFHPAHPFVLPEQFLLALTPAASLHVLLPAMRWVGSLYISVPLGTRASLLDEAHSKLTSSSVSSNTTTPRDGFLVQAMMVLLVGLDGLCELDKARRMLRDVGQLAVEIGLHSRAFATLHGQGVPVLEESWRRTWWDLYVVDGMIAGLHRASNFALNDIHTDVALPCEEWQYLSGVAIPPPRSFDDLDNSVFADAHTDNNTLSSFAYRIQSARTLGQLLRLPSHTHPDDPALSKVEASLTSWRLHLPRSKHDAVSPDGGFDEVMFQAHMVHHATSILLHHPYSRLGSLHARNVTSCAPDRPLVPAAAAAAAGADTPFFNAHTRHVVAAAGEISRLITHRAPLRSRTPFFTCVVVLASVIHLNQWAALFSSRYYAGPGGAGDGGGDDDESFLREKVRLSIGALAGMSEVWRTAAVALGQVRGVAREIYEAKRKRQETEADAAAVEAWSGVVEDSFAADVPMTCPMMDP